MCGWLQMNEADLHLEKAELEKRLLEKEQAQRQQMEMISKLQDMLVTSSTNSGPDKAVSHLLHQQWSR